MKECVYFPCSKSGNLLRGYSRTKGSITSYLKDLRIWKSFGVRYVSLNGFVHSVD